jgi:hypothetical protein
MPSFRQDAFATPFGRNVYLRSTVGIKTESYTFSMKTMPSTTIDGNPGQKILQPGVVLAKITSGSDIGKVGPYQPGGSPANEVQTVTITGTPTGGTFTLTYNGQTTAGIAFNATAAAVQTALEALSNIEPGDIATGGGPFPGTAVTVTFQGTLGGTDQPQMTANSAGLTGGTTPTATVTTTTPGVAGATDGRQTAANIVGINNTFLPWQLIERDVEVAAVYDAAVIQANCLELLPAGTFQPMQNATATAMVAQKGMNILFK